MKNVNVIEKFNLDPKTRAVVIGGGVMGVMAGIEIAKSGIGNVELFDEGGERATDAAGAQFLPLAVGDNPLLDPVSREVLPAETSYFPCILQGFQESRAYYEDRAVNPGSGVTKASLMELRNDAMFFRRYLVDIMDARLHDLACAHTLEGGDGKPVVYDGYYYCQSFGIDTAVAHADLKKQFQDLGGVWHDNSQITPGAVASLDQAFAVVAAGSRAQTVRGFLPFPLYKKYGMSATYRTDVQLPDLPMLSYDDLVFRPHPDRYGITVGGFDLSNYGDTKEKSRVEAVLALDRRLRDVENPIGPWEGLPLDVLRRTVPRIRFGTRAVGMFGLSIEQDTTQYNVFHMEGSGSVGWSLAPWASRLVARFVGDANENFTPGTIHRELLEKTGEPEYPYTPRSSMRERQYRPSSYILEWQEAVKSVDQAMAAIAVARTMNAYSDTVQRFQMRSSVQDE